MTRELKDLHGRAPRGSVVEVFAGEKSLGKIEADAGGFWKIQGVPIPSDISHVRAIATDDRGNKTPSLALDVDDEQDVEASADYADLVAAVAEGASFDTVEAEQILAAVGADAERLEHDAERWRELDRQTQSTLSDFRDGIQEKLAASWTANEWNDNNE